MKSKEKRRNKEKWREGRRNKEEWREKGREGNGRKKWKITSMSVLFIVSLVSVVVVFYVYLFLFFITWKLIKFVNCNFWLWFCEIRRGGWHWYLWLVTRTHGIKSLSMDIIFCTRRRWPFTSTWCGWQNEKFNKRYVWPETTSFVKISLNQKNNITISRVGLLIFEPLL